MDYEFVICFLIDATESIAQFFFLPRLFSHCVCLL